MKEAMAIKGFLILADGTVYPGESFGAAGVSEGEVVFNTSMTGYQEILTDPSYCGQIISMTYPLIGNYGVNPQDFESRKPFARGLVVREYCQHPNNWRATSTLADFLLENNIMGLTGIDTRSLTRRLRNQGTMKGILTTDENNLASLVCKARQPDPLDSPDYVGQATTKKEYELGGDGYPVVVVDLGAKQSIINTLVRAGYHVTVVPADTAAADILAKKPRGVLYSNGPGNPKAAPYAVASARALMGKTPLFGICLGHQIFSLALGADTYKLPFGHRGSNHPVKDLATGRVAITSQNHGYAVAEDALARLDVTITHRSLNDGTIEGFKHKFMPIFSVQYHPEAYPGPTDSLHLFDEFKNLMINHSN
jgi:carbamoyl-phosphate synthase small subunit